MGERISAEEKILSLAVALLLIAQFSLLGLEHYGRVSEASGAEAAAVAVTAEPIAGLCTPSPAGQICFSAQGLTAAEQHYLLQGGK